MDDMDKNNLFLEDEPVTEVIIKKPTKTTKAKKAAADLDLPILLYENFKRLEKALLAAGHDVVVLNEKPEPLPGLYALIATTLIIVDDHGKKTKHKKAIWLAIAKP